jgi:uncharacterized protein YprB with RNaseH-like and TPR domain
MTIIMALDEKLRRLKKERDLRSRTRASSVEDAWARIDKDGEATVKEKLEKLINLTGQAKKPKPENRATFEPEPREPLQVFENTYPQDAIYGKTRISDGLRIRSDVLTVLSRDEAFSGLDLSTALFLDLETTGLAGGTGTVAFLVGMGYYREGAFHVTQFFLGDMGEEERLIRGLADFFGEMNFGSVVTYNGKAFDVPLLETRFILFRKPYPLSDLPHLDLLFTARNLWKHKHESCRLFHLAQQIVEAARSEDIPSAEIPFRYFDYLRSGNFSLIEPILYHNQEDILSLLGLTVAAAKLFADDQAEEADAIDALDMVGVGKVLESVGSIEKSVALFERALKNGLPGELAVSVKTKLSYHYKSRNDPERAEALWKDLAEHGGKQVEALRELAMYYEHKKKNYEDAKRAAEEGLALATSLSDRLRGDFEHRLERLNDKLRRHAGAEQVRTRRR